MYTPHQVFSPGHRNRNPFSEQGTMFGQAKDMYGRPITNRVNANTDYLAMQNKQKARQQGGGGARGGYGGGAVGGGAVGGHGGAGGAGMGQVTNKIQANPVLNDTQTQHLVNQGVAANDTSAGSALLQQLQNPNLSPAARHQLLNQTNAARMNANSQVRTNTPIQTAQLNADHLLRAQTAQGNFDLGNAGLLAQLQGQQLGHQAAMYGAQMNGMNGLLGLLNGI